MTNNPVHVQSKSINAGLLQRIYENYGRYDPYLRTMLEIGPRLFSEIEVIDPSESSTPGWRQAYFSWADALSLCAVLRHRNPRRYLEVGSGNSTRFARWCINSYNLQTKIISVDPDARVEVSNIADEIHKCAIEAVDCDVIFKLSGNDIFFYDASHNMNMGTDMSYVCFDLFPSLNKSVMMGFHDTYLPVLGWNAEDYHAGALFLGGDRYQPELPTHYLTCVDRRSRAPLMDLFRSEPASSVLRNHYEMFAHLQNAMDNEMHGATFFFSRAS